MSKLQELLKLTDEELYEIYNEGEPVPASKGVINSYKELNNALDTYIVEVSQYAFSCGFHYAIKVMEGGRV